MKFLIVLFFVSVNAFAGTATKREAAVEGAYRLFPIFMRALTQDPASKELPNEQYGFLRQMAELVTRQTIPLRFNPNVTDFDLEPGQPRRWMRTPIINSEWEWDWSQDAIEVNPELLNAAQEEITIPFLLKILFHEWTHKIRYRDQAFRDQVAQYIETRAQDYFRAYDLDDGMRLQVFSMPLRAIDEIVDHAPLDRPQPTNLALLEREGTFEDLTESMLKATEKTSTVTRSIMTGVSGAMYAVQRQFAAIFSEIIPAMSEGLNEIVSAFGVKPLPPPDIEGLKARLHELRILEVQEVEALPQAEDVFVRMKALWSFSRTNRSFKINADGFPMQENFPVPMSIVVRIPKSPLVPVHPADFQVNARMQMDLDAQARVQTVMRNSDGRIAKVVVALVSDARPGKVSLSAVYGQGSRLLPASAIEPGKPGQWNLTFEPQWPFLPKADSLVAEAVLIETHKMVYLNRLVELSPDTAEPASGGPTNALVPDSLVLRGLKAGAAHAFKNFQFGEPVLLATNIKSELGSLDPDNIPVEFMLERDEKVREIRLMIRRSTYVVDVQDKDKPPMTDDEIREQMGGMFWDGKLILMGRGGHMVAMKDFNETLSATPDAIIRQETTHGTQVRASLRAPFLAAGELQSRTQAHYAAMATPVAVEIVLDSGQMITHTFGDALKEEYCQQILDPAGLGRGIEEAIKEAKAKGEFKMTWGNPKDSGAPKD